MITMNYQNLITFGIGGRGRVVDSSSSDTHVSTKYSSGISSINRSSSEPHISTKYSDSAYYRRELRDLESRKAPKETITEVKKLIKKADERLIKKIHK